MTKLGTAAQALAARRLKVAEGWRAAHPARAAEEAALAAINARTLADFRQEALGTPQTRAKARQVQQGSLARMYQAGQITANQLAWSAEINAAHVRIVSGLKIGSMSMETRVDQSGAPGVFFEKLGAVRAEVAYSRWRRALPCPGPVLAMIVGDLGVSAAAKFFGMRTERARRLLLVALDQWPDFHRDACDLVDEDDLARIHARLGCAA